MKFQVVEITTGKVWGTFVSGAPVDMVVNGKRTRQPFSDPEALAQGMARANNKTSGFLRFHVVIG